MKPIARFMHPVLPAAKLGRKPRRVVVDGDAYVLFRDGRGRPAALVDRCPHRYAPLSAGHVDSRGDLACPYHGWRFDRHGRGRSPSQPELSRCDVEALRVEECRDYLWIGGPEADASSMQELTPEGFEAAGHFRMTFEAPLHVVLDNFSEDEHTPFVHTRLGWDEQDLSTLEFEAENHADHTAVYYRARQRDSWLAPVLRVKRGDIFHNRWQTRFNPVRTTYEIHWTDARTGRLRPIQTCAVVYFVPIDAQRTQLHTFASLKLHQRRLRPLLPAIQRAAIALSWLEFRDDARFVPLVADTPLELRGMRLGRYDKPLIHNHKLLARIYRGQGATAADVARSA